MGSKASLLAGELGDLITAEVKTASRFIDLFSGSAAVSWYVARRLAVPVVANDLQFFAQTLASSVVARESPLDTEMIWRQWCGRYMILLEGFKSLRQAVMFEGQDWRSNPDHHVKIARQLSAAAELPISSAYGGYYYSPLQVLQLDALRASLPEPMFERNAALAALIHAASSCAASPGHTAQPFSPTSTGARHLFESWQKDILAKTKAALAHVAPLCARVAGEARHGEALELVPELNEDDVVFVDPPYSNVQYSRFYHVLETVSRGGCGPVAGVGRYPPRSERPQSSYSWSSEAKLAIKNLFNALGRRRCRVIVTFPAGRASNGLSGELVRELAESCFQVQGHVVEGRFSTLGGNGGHRPARVSGDQVVLVLRPE